MNPRLIKLLGFLTNDKQEVLGIWGMDGVGKITLQEGITDVLVEDLNSFGFDKVASVMASIHCTIENIQNGCAEKLYLSEKDLFASIGTHKRKLILTSLDRQVCHGQTVKRSENALELLCRSTVLWSLAGLDNPLPLLKISYDYLKDPKEIRYCFIRCALWPEDISSFKGMLHRLLDGAWFARQV